MPHSGPFEKFKSQIEERGYRLTRWWSHKREQSEIVGYGVVTTRPGLAPPKSFSIVVEHWPEGFDLFLQDANNSVEAGVTALLGSLPVGDDENIGSIPA